MKKVVLFLMTIISILGVGIDACAQSTRAERKAITEGNRLFTERKYLEAAQKYEEALIINAESAVAAYNLGLSQIRQVINPQDTAPQTEQMLGKAKANLSKVAAMAKEKPGLASKANYNLGNLAFNRKQYKEAIDYYKQSLRIDPNDEAARKNLRIAQKQQQNQDQNKDQNQNQDQNKDQNQDKNQDQNKNQNNNQDQNKDQNQQQPPKENEISEQAANQILQAMDNKENQTRARVNRARKGEEAAGAAANRKKW